jgi:hypothetical protein
MYAIIWLHYDLHDLQEKEFKESFQGKSKHLKKKTTFTKNRF